MDKGKKWHGIYEIEGDTMRAAVGPTDKDRPAKYDDPPEGVRAFVLKREKKKWPPQSASAPRLCGKDGRQKPESRVGYPLSGPRAVGLYLACRSRRVQYRGV